MIARHFMSDDEVIAELTKDPDFSAEDAAAMLRQHAPEPFLLASIRRNIWRVIWLAPIP